MESIANLLILSIFQVLSCMGFLLSGDSPVSVLLGYGGIMIAQWALLIFYIFLRRPAFELETLAFLLCSMGMAAICAVKPGEAVKQLVALVLGIGIFLIVAWSMRDLERAKKMRYWAAVGGVFLLGITLVFGREIYGAKNWLVIGPVSIQPSELAKVCFVYVGASSMDRLMKKRNLIGFIVYSVLICGCLALMNDFGTAMIFFCAFLMIAYLRSGSVGTVAMAITALAFAGVIALKLAPHALRRFAIWGRIWDDPLNAGYQQTRAMMCIASGGFFGLGIGQGWMKNLFAADSDMVFATIAEEWGLVMPLLLVLAIIAVALFGARCAGVSRSSFYAIGACTAGAVLVVQTIFNVLGTLDILPLTGVTMPFVSNGGSSMMCSWGLLAFIKAADTRKSASFAVRKGRNGGFTYE
jgi:cell division protein FtsW (lipid II flippase)